MSIYYAAIESFQTAHMRQVPKSRVWDLAIPPDSLPKCWWRSSSSIDFPPVSHAHHQNNQLCILNIGNDAVISYPVFPVIAQF
jgi:hypothetical protein